MRRPVFIGTVLACLGLPALAVLVDAASQFAANRSTGVIVIAGKERDYIVHVPPGYDPAKPTPLVISLHGAGNWGAFQMNVTGMNRVADKHGFIVAYPSGEGGGKRIWGMRGLGNPQKMPDVVFLSALIDRLQAEYNIDPARIYANGYSNGGGMSFVLSCTLSHRIAAIGAVAAAETVPWAWCRDSTPVPMIAIHGTADRITPYNGGKVWVAQDPFPSIPGWAENWARRNRCSPVPVDSRVAHDVMRREYFGCASDATVVLYTLEGIGHTWPGGPHPPEWALGRTTQSIDASELMWAFFREHPLRR
jgi:polyhydroxybutyrate depolymerase